MYPHQAERLTDAVARGGVDALVATSPENIAYITGFRSLTEAVFHTTEFGVFTRQGTALVVPAIDPPTIVADAINVDHVVCFGGFRAPFAEPLTAEVKRIQWKGRMRFKRSVERARRRVRSSARRSDP